MNFLETRHPKSVFPPVCLVEAVSLHQRELSRSDLDMGTYFFGKRECMG